MKNRNITTLTGILVSCASNAYAGGFAQPQAPDISEEIPFENARRPISNPTLFDLALPTTNIHPFFMHHNLPSTVNTTAGNLPMGGDVQIYALQFEYALSERLSTVASKDGFVHINAGNTALWSDASGFANLGAGLKYAFIYDPANEFVLSGTAVIELPPGNDDVFQGQGDGVVNLIVSSLKMWDDFQLAGAAGTHRNQRRSKLQHVRQRPCELRGQQLVHPACGTQLAPCDFTGRRKSGVQLASRRPGSGSGKLRRIRSVELRRRKLRREPRPRHRRFRFPLAPFRSHRSRRGL